MNLFTQVTLAPSDPILGLNEVFNHDPRSYKINLGLGVYVNENGKIPVMQAVTLAKKLQYEQDPTIPHIYLPIDGLAKYQLAVQKLLFSNKPDSKIVTIQTLGGTGALKIGADFLKKILPNSQVALSEPSWENHSTLFGGAGFTITKYPYYDTITRGLNFEGMLSGLQKLDKQSIVVLHACCHNPTGVDLTQEQWQEVLVIIQERKHIPFIDLAYQGFGESLAKDKFIIDLLLQAEVPFLLASSFSKSFALYGERVGALTVNTDSIDVAEKVRSQLKLIIRRQYSNPPTYGAKIVSEILSANNLHNLWAAELDEFRLRMQLMRTTLLNLLSKYAHGYDFGFIAKQRGMFSYSGLSKAQVTKLREQYAIYALDSGRICIAALNVENITQVAQAIGQVIQN